MAASNPPPRHSKTSMEELAAVFSRHANVPSSVTRTLSDLQEKKESLAEVKALATMEGLSSCQRYVARALDHKYFDSVMGLVIVSNLIVMGWDADHSASCVEANTGSTCVDTALTVVNTAFLLVYTAEAAMRLYVLRLSYFLVSWNILDAVIVVTGWFDMIILIFSTGTALPSLNSLRIFRMLRLARAIRLASVFPELYSMVQGFRSAMMAMWWGFVMIVILLLVFSIAAVELVLPIQLEFASDDGPCDEAFVSVFNSVVYFFQTLVAGDSWGQCSVPLLKIAPWTCGLLFSMALVFIQLGFTNLILAVIVETAAAAREADVEQLARNKEKQTRETTLQLQELVSRMDTDGNGTITVNELLNAYDGMPELSQLLTMLDINKDDLLGMFSVMDNDNSGDLSPTEFIRSIQRAQTQDYRVQMMVMRLQIAKICEALQETQDVLYSMLGKDTASEQDNDDGVPPDYKGFSPHARRTIRLAGKRLQAAKTRMEGMSRTSSHSPSESGVAPPVVSASPTMSSNPRQISDEQRQPLQGKMDVAHRKLEAFKQEQLEEKLANLIKEQTNQVLELLCPLERRDPILSNGSAMVAVDCCDSTLRHPSVSVKLQAKAARFENQDKLEDVPMPQLPASPSRAAACPPEATSRSRPILV